MTSSPENEPAASPPEEKSHQLFFQSLTDEEKMLVELRDELYGGSWELMLEDLNDRLKGRPYIFKLANRIEEDIQRIQKLRSYENKHNINLRAYTPEPKA